MIYARFTPTLTNITTKAVTQWDYGRSLRIEGLELPTAIRIDFGVSGGQTTVSRIGITKDRVTDVVIPDSLLEQSINIVAYVYVSDTTEGKTVRTINIPVTARAKPEEYDSPESKELFAEAIEMVNDVAVRAKNAEAEAKAHADSARASLEATEQTAETAVNAVNSAGAAQVQAIGKKGSETVSAVKAEGETQLQAIAEETAQIVADRERINSNYRNKAGAIVLDAQGESIVLNDASEYPLQSMSVYGKSTQDGTPTPDAPVDIVSVEKPAVSVCGKNLLKQTCTTKTVKGVTFTVNIDGSITANGTSTDVFAFAINDKLTGLKKGEMYTISGNPTYSADYMLYFDQKDTSGKALGSCQDYGQGKTAELSQYYDYLWVGIFSQAGVVFNNLTFYPMIRLASVDDDNYEPYIETQAVETTHTLHGIPVTSGGNYTDADGQQWICDEVDLARGVYVQRIGIVESYVDEAIPELYMSTTGELSEGAMVLYVLSEPIETPLSDAEINAFKALHSNKPVTTILNDAGAHMAVEYVADTKTYIDRQISALLSN